MNPLRIQCKPRTVSLKKKSTFSQNAACKFREFMEAPDSVPGTPRGSEPRRPLPLHRAGCQQRPQLVALPLIVLVHQGPGELRQAGFHALLAGPLRRALPASILPLSPRSVPAPGIISLDARPSLSSESFCHHGARFAMAAVPLQALRTTLLTIPPQHVPWPRRGQLRTLLGKASGQDSG